MATVIKSKVKPPALTRNGWKEAEAAYIADVRKTVPTAPKSRALGEVVRFPVGDGYACYMIEREAPLRLIWLEIGDAWQAPAALIRGLRLGDLQNQIEARRLAEQRELEQERYYADLPVGATVHYDNGFAEFVRCVRVEGKKGQRLMPVALIGNWNNPDYYQKRIADQAAFEPNIANIWELKDKAARAYSMRSCQPPRPGQVVNLPHYTAPFDPTVELPRVFNNPRRSS